MTEHRELVLVTPDLFDYSGGIARIARAAVFACHKVCTERDWKLTAVVLRDRGAARDSRYLPPGSGYVPCGNSRAMVARAVLTRAIRPRQVGTIFCHVNLATIGLLFPPRRFAVAREFVIIAHGVDVWNPLSIYRRSALRLAREVWPVSNFTASVVRESGVHPKRVRTIYNCLDPFWDGTSLDKTSWRPGRFILCVSRLSYADRDKGVDDLIAAFGMIAQHVEDVRLVIAGEGDDAGRLRQLASSGPARDRIDFVGFVSEAELRWLYSHCELFAMPSRSEGFGLAFLEAMANGKAVIGANSTATPEVVVDGETGQLVPYGDRRSLADAMLVLVNDRARASAMGLRGEERVRRRFSFERYAKDLGTALTLIWGGSAEMTRQEAGAA